MRSPFLRAAGLRAAGLSLAALAACGEAAPRNTLLVTLDTTRPDFFGCYGHAGGLTPNFDALGAAGVRFERASTSSALTPVAHASLLTGLHPFEHGVRVLLADGGYALRADVPTLASTLRERGWHTAAFSSAFPVSRHYGFERGFEVFEDVGAAVRRVDGGDGLGWESERGQRRSDRTTALALGYLASVEEPFFVWVHYWDPHDAKLLPPEPFLAGARASAAAAGGPRDSETYAAEIAWVDRQFGRLVGALERSGRGARTLIAVIADHGEGLTDGHERHGWSGHRILYEEQMRVPLLLRGPLVPPGRAIDAWVRSVDLYPSVLDYLDVAPPTPVSGRSLRPLVDGDEDAARIAYAEQINQFDLNAYDLLQRRPRANLIHCVRDGAWKLLYQPSYPDASELYDLDSDPGELDNRFASEPELARRLSIELARLDGWVLEPFRFEGGAISTAAVEILAGLGYVGADEPGAAASSARWEWRCPTDASRHPAKGPCSKCGGPLLPAAVR